MLFSSLFDIFKSEPVVKTKILFVVKKRTLPHYDQIGKTVSTGLKNSAGFVVQMLNSLGDFDAKLVEVNDNNDIDRQVNLFKPDVVVIEALWVVPEKFDVLKKLHPEVKWVIRLHSDTPFLANEGVALEWIQNCARVDNVWIAANSFRIFKELQHIIGHHNVILLPNFYPLNKYHGPNYKKEPGIIDISCFGAIRPMKNHLIQAMAAMRFADSKRMKLRFHINGNRCEGHGDPVLRNLRALFQTSTKHELVEHPWLDHLDFLDLISTMDISMQVSMSETFNIVSCDAVSCGVPVVVSPEIDWVNSIFYAQATNSISIINALSRAWLGRFINLQKTNYWGLDEANQEAQYRWCEEIKKINKKKTYRQYH